MAEFRSEVRFDRQPLRPVQVLGQVWSIQSSTKYGVLRVHITTDVVSVNLVVIHSTEYQIQYVILRTDTSYR